VTRLDVSERAFSESPWIGPDGRWWIVRPDGNLLRVRNPSAKRAFVDAVLAEVAVALRAVLDDLVVAAEDDAA
jgi:hypothetical protein